jgi:DNA-binding NarL/FixJ family response regulator
MTDEEDLKSLLREIRDLLVIQLRQGGVSNDTIGRQLGISGKSVRNRYPLGNERPSSES